MNQMNPMMNPFPEFPQLPISKTLPELSLETKVNRLERFILRLENDFSQRFFDLEGQAEKMSEKVNLLQERQENIEKEQFELSKRMSNLSTRIEWLRVNVGENSRENAETKEEICEIHEDLKSRDQRLDSLRDTTEYVSDHCSHVEKESRTLKCELKDMNDKLEQLTKESKDHQMVVSQVYFKNRGYESMIQGAFERMDDFEKATRSIRNVCATGIQEIKEKMDVFAAEVRFELDQRFKTWESESVSETQSQIREIFTCEISETGSQNCETVSETMSEISFQELEEQLEGSHLPIAPSLSSDLYEKQFPSL